MATRPGIKLNKHDRFDVKRSSKIATVLLAQFYSSSNIALNRGDDQAHRA
jgi:hypothetical protein